MDINSFVIGYKKGKASGGGGMEGLHAVRYYNDDRTTLLYTAYVSTGSIAIYAGDTPVSAVNPSLIFLGFEPATANITADTDCYALYTSATTLNETEWSAISALSAQGMAENYFAVGDTKMIHIEGKVGTLAVNGDYGVYIIGFDHNEELEGKGIHFGTFKSAESNGTDLCLIDSAYGTYPMDGSRVFNMNHSGQTNFGGWAMSNMRYDILGSVDKVQTTNTVVNASPTCATEPVSLTLMGALPTDLRAVMKPMTKYTNNKGRNPTEATASIDYLPLPSLFEINGEATSSIAQEEANCQKQYAYFAAGNSKIKYSDSGTARDWYVRTPNNELSTHFLFMSSKGSCAGQGSNFVRGIAPIFKV